MANGKWSQLVGGLMALNPMSNSNSQTGAIQLKTVNANGADYDFQVFVPSSLTDTKNAPLIVFLHGIGQRGTGALLPTEGASAKVARHFLDQAPAIVLVPRCQPDSFWSGPEMSEMVIRAIEQTIVEFDVDRRRIYLTGVSMGGYGVWHFAYTHPEMFAALVSICGGSSLHGDDRFAPIAVRAGKTPAWVFHGENDQTVSVTESRQMVEALKANGGNVRYTEYPGADHSIWMKVLGESNLFPWMLEQRRE